MTYKIALVCGIVVSILAFPVLFLISLNIFAYDLPGFDDSDLLGVTAGPSSDEENIHVVFEELIPRMYYPRGQSTQIEELARGTNRDEQLEEALLSRNADFLDLFDRVEFEGVFQDPRLLAYLQTNPYVEREWFVSNIRRMVDISHVAARAHMREGDIRAALDRGIRSIQLASFLLDSELHLIDYLSTQRIKRSGLDLLHDIIPSLSVTSDEYWYVHDRLDAIESSRRGLIGSLQFEYVFWANRVDDFADRDPRALRELGWEDLNSGFEGSILFPYRYLFQPNTTKHYYATLVRRSITDSYRACREEPVIIDVPVRFDVNKKPIRQYVEPNKYGRLLHDVTAVQLDLVPRHCELELELVFIKTLLALKAYQDTYHTLPDALEEMVPEFLHKVPIDILTDQSLSYSREERILYSRKDRERHGMQINF